MLPRTKRSVIGMPKRICARGGGIFWRFYKLVVEGLGEFISVVVGGDVG